MNVGDIVEQKFTKELSKVIEKLPYHDGLGHHFKLANGQVIHEASINYRIVDKFDIKPKCYGSASCANKHQGSVSRKCTFALPCVTLANM